jgi:hypothetical protein
MTGRARAALLRLAIISAAWALGEALVWQLRAGGLALIVPALLGAAAYIATREGGWPGAGGGDETYWRGRRIDRNRWN